MAALGVSPTCGECLLSEGECVSPTMCKGPCRQRTAEAGWESRAEALIRLLFGREKSLSIVDMWGGEWRRPRKFELGNSVTS